jgi:molybdopterin molybdotransferase
VGTYDLVRDAFKPHGLELDFWKIAMRPGRPLMSGQLGKTPMIGLPGNPVAAMVCSVVFVQAAIRALMGQKVSEKLETETAILGTDLKQNDQRQDFLRCTLTPQPDGQLPLATPFASQDSAQLNILAKSNALLIRAPHAPAVKAGAVCNIMRLP